MSAAGALITMSAQRSGAATGDGQQHLLMLPANPSETALYEVVTSTVNDLGHRQRRSVHALRDTPLPLNLAQRHQAGSTIRACVRRSRSGFVQVDIAEVICGSIPGCRVDPVSQTTGK
jgi:hypothetical protein